MGCIEAFEPELTASKTGRPHHRHVGRASPHHVVALVLLAECGGPRRPPSSGAPAQCAPPPGASVDVAVVDVDPLADVFVPDASPALTHPIGEWPCTGIDRRNAAALALVERTGEGEARYSGLARCYPTRGRAWAVVLGPGSIDHFEWSLRHLDAGGQEVGPTDPAVRSERTFIEQGDRIAPPYHHTGPMTLFDFDGDGEPEIAFTVEGASEHGESEELEAFRYRAGRVEAFATVRNAHHLEDVDRDGRPDVVIIHSRYSRTTTEPSDISCGAMVEAPSVAARSLPGGRFSLSDPAVREYNRRECSVRPAAIVARDADGLVDEEATARNVVCAGVWGVRRATIVAALRACGERVTTPECETVVRRPDGCRHAWLLSQWATEFP
ncbi:MAG: hypothetical protein JWM10_3688 [Myxococcaceae bacterium]|nr:hypothetical protein [Myxococcaceae bacterium]